MADGAHRAVALTLTVEDDTDLEHGFTRLRAVKANWQSKIKNHDLDAYVTSTELTEDEPRWHWHLHAVIFGDHADPDALVCEWIAAAREAGIAAHPSGQHATTDYSPQAALSYALKSKLGSGPHSLFQLLTRAARGEADAADRWTELEDFYTLDPRRRWRSSWKRRPATNHDPVIRTTPSTFDYSDSPTLRRLVLLDLLNVRGKDQQAAFLTDAGYQGGPATVGRARRYPPYKAFREARPWEALDQNPATIPAT